VKKESKLPLDKAMIIWFLNEYKYGSINRFDLFIKFRELFFSKKIGNEKIEVHGNTNLELAFKRFTNEYLEEEPFVKAYSPHSTGYGYFAKINTKLSPIELIFPLFPYAYLTHLSAMRHYSITDRIPKKIQIEIPSRPKWKALLTEDIKKMDVSAKDKDIILKYLPRYPKSDEIYFKKRILVSSIRTPLPYLTLDNGVRVVEIGALFVEMINNPKECGGIEHVMDVFQEYGLIFKKKIYKVALESSLIAQARIGFIFEQILEQSDPEILKMKSRNKDLRGGSRVFLTGEDFSNIINIEWNLSLNHPSVESYGIEFNPMG